MKTNFLNLFSRVQQFSFLFFISAFLISTAQSREDRAGLLYDDSEVAIVNIYINPDVLEWVMDPANVTSNMHHPATVHFKNTHIDETIDSVGFRLRGNTSRHAQKKSFKLSFNTYVPGRQFYDVDKINLNGEHNDPSIIRSKLCWDLFQTIGLTASRAAHAAVYINDEYYGLYVSVEHIDDEFLKNHYNDPSGNLWKCLYPADLTYRGDDPSNYHPYFEDVRPYELKTNRDEYDYGPLARLIKVINQTPDEQFADSLQEVIHIPQVLKYLAVNILTGSWDDYWALMNNYYLYHEPSADIFHFIPYDYDNTFGIDWFNIDWASIDPYTFGRVVDGPRPLATRIMANNRLRNLYTHFLKFYREQVYLLYHWESRLDSLRDLITPWAIIDTYAGKDYGFTFYDFQRSYTNEEYANQHVKYGIKQFVNLRTNYLLGQMKWVESGPSVYAVDWHPRHPAADDSIYVTVSAFSQVGLQDVRIQLHPGSLTVIEEYPLRFQPVPGSKRVEEADRWQGVIPPLADVAFGQFEILATDKQGRTHLYPGTKRFYIEVVQPLGQGPLINEFMARNATTIADDRGQYDDWLEIYNPTQQSVDLSLLYLTDKLNNLTRWRFPARDVILGPGEFLLVWCDGDTNQSGLHTNFKLDGDGEFIALVDRDGVSILDSVSFAAQQFDISMGRYPDGSGDWRLMSPTPLQPNLATSLAEETLPETFDLLVYPNPFNPLTTISYTLPEAGAVELSIYNYLGQKVATLYSGQQPAGTHRIVWDGSADNTVAVSAGLYICRLQAGKYEVSRKVILLK